VVYCRLLNDVNGAGAAIFQRMYTVDSTRIQLLADGVGRAQECFIFGCGFGSASSFIMGENVKIHNAYIGSLADIGILGLTGLTILMLQPIKTFRSTLEREKDAGNCNILIWIAMMGVLGYGFTMTLHPLSSELSEWGIWIVMVSWLSTLCAAKIQQTNNQRLL
jgi:O-antigen ligase